MDAASIRTQTQEPVMVEAPHRGAGPSRPGSSRRGVGFLVAGGVLSAVNGAAHLALPVVYPWAQHVEGLYEPVRWALYATTAFFAVLLVFCGALTVWVATARDVPARVVAFVAGGMAAFWLLGAAYEVVVPFPAAGADRALPAFSVTVAVLYMVGLWLRVRPRAPTPPPAPVSGAPG